MNFSIARMFVHIKNVFTHDVSHELKICIGSKTTATDIFKAECVASTLHNSHTRQ